MWRGEGKGKATQEPLAKIASGPDRNTSPIQDDVTGSLNPNAVILLVQMFLGLNILAVVL